MTISDQIRSLVAQGLTSKHIAAACKRADPSGLDEVLRAIRPTGQPIPIDKRLICIGDPTWPERLDHFTMMGGPWWLWCEGITSALSCPTTVAIVGTRQASADGLQLAYTIANDLAQHGITVVSGMAQGIDQAAHRGCLAGGGLTIGVLGCGLEVPYPANATALKAEVIAQGCLVSEQPPAMPIAYPGQFLERNRIIAGLADAVVIIEAKQRSGALNTAGWAATYNRECLVVPSSPTNRSAAGSLALIRDGCLMVRNGHDVREALGLTNSADEPVSGVPPVLHERVQEIYTLLGPQPTAMDTLCAHTGLPIAEVMARCGELMNAGLASMTGEGIYRLT
ncbi:DNA-processing protein DprA [Stomatohabitans albus]|uniref:DNA-processing protein DprA n=1 Tax=Stomatohabitans albus TaxID=3110766 RepID=UPI00300C978B